MSKRQRRRQLRREHVAPSQDTGLGFVESMMVAGIRRDLPELQAADVVFAVPPDGQSYLIKGKVRLSAITASGINRECKIVFGVPVPSLEAAAALQAVLGNDGNLVVEAGL